MEECAGMYPWVLGLPPPAEAAEASTAMHGCEDVLRKTSRQLAHLELGLTTLAEMRRSLEDLPPEHPATMERLKMLQRTKAGVLTLAHETCRQVQQLLLTAAAGHLLPPERLMLQRTFSAKWSEAVTDFREPEMLEAIQWSVMSVLEQMEARSENPERIIGQDEYVPTESPCGTPAEQTEKERCTVDVRWMIRRDLPDVLQVEQQSFEYAWTEEDFLRCLLHRNCIGMVAERGGKIAGFMMYELHNHKLHLLNFAVHPAFRRKGVATQMIETLKRKLASHRRTRISLEVRETNLQAQLFFRSQYFTARRVLPSYYEENDEDAYTMEYNVGDTIPRPGMHTAHNRLRAYFDALEQEDTNRTDEENS